MKKFTLGCRCGSINTDVMSCERVEKNVVEITYTCNYCGTTEEVRHFLYNADFTED